MGFNKLMQLPDWVSWMAQDSDGSWWAYEYEPNLHDSGWYENEAGRILNLKFYSANYDWVNSLKKLQ